MVRRRKRLVNLQIDACLDVQKARQQPLKPGLRRSPRQVGRFDSGVRLLYSFKRTF
jgi:hypothetical protein